MELFKPLPIKLKSLAMSLFSPFATVDPDPETSLLKPFKTAPNTPETLLEPNCGVIDERLWLRTKGASEEFKKVAIESPIVFVKILPSEVLIASSRYSNEERAGTLPEIALPLIRIFDADRAEDIVFIYLAENNFSPVTWSFSVIDWVFMICLERIGLISDAIF